MPATTAQRAYSQIRVTSASAWTCALGLVLHGCIGPGPRLSPELAGCYRLTTTEWSREHARVTGLPALPDVIALDSAFLGRVLLPASWSLADPRHERTATLFLAVSPMIDVGDSIIFDRYDRPRALGRDSIIVVIRSRVGAISAFLERDGRGFSGQAVITPREMIRRGRRQIGVRLDPASCPSDLR
jgi:hypothetical protein